MADVKSEDYPFCTTCNDRRTKYECVACGVVICNICSLNVDVEYPGYSEENKRIGVCKTCDTFVTEENQSKSEDLKAVTQINFNTVSKPPLKKQKKIGLVVCTHRKRKKPCCFRCSFYLAIARKI